METLPGDVRDRLAGRVVELYAADGAPERRDTAVVVHALLSSGRADDLKASDHMSADRQRLLEAGTRQTWNIAEISHVARLELLSGRDIPVPLGAVIRRDDSYRCDRKREVVRLLFGRHPVLNAGEQLSDRVLAEMEDLPTEWTDLVEHAATVSSGSRPGAAWERKGRALLARVEGPDFRERVLRWLALVGGPPTSPREGSYRGYYHFDQYNYRWSA